ncbi:MAG: recombination protein NinG [Candidatus Nanopelagicaceae bacterium]
MRKSKNKSLAKAKADKYFSEYIRLRDADSDGIATCCTCGKRDHWKQMDAGHFITRDRLATRYHEQNCHAQCRLCNRFQGGHQYKHAKHVEEMYGRDVPQEILELSQQVTKYSQTEFELHAERYREAAADIRSCKGL